MKPNQMLKTLKDTLKLIRPRHIHNPKNLIDMADKMQTIVTVSGSTTTDTKASMTFEVKPKVFVEVIFKSVDPMRKVGRQPVSKQGYMEATVFAQEGDTRINLTEPVELDSFDDILSVYFRNK